MFNVTPIGSCRITAPLRYGQSHHGIHLNQARCYGYCHSPAEAVQLARFIRGEAQIPHDIWPLVSRSHQYDVIAAQEHFASDLYIIELASAKELTIDGVSIQLNYLNATYKEFFADTERAQQFWAYAESGDGDAMSAFLDREWSATKLQRAQSTLLGRIRLQFVTRKSLARDIRKLAKMLPDILFVSHVDALRSNGEPIGSRSNFIRLVQEETGKADMRFCNPTELMVEFGQPAAIEDDSTSLAHFTPAFSNAVMDSWMQEFIAPMTDGAVNQNFTGALESLLLPQISAACHRGRFADAETRLDALSRTAVEVEPLLNEVREQQQTAQDALDHEIATCAELTRNTAETDRLIERAAALGRFGQALTLATGTDGGLMALPPHILTRIGAQAVAAGDIDNAFEFVLAAYLQNNHLLRASSMLANLSIAEEIDLLSELTADEVTNILSHLAPLQKLQLLQLNGAAPSAAISDDTTPEDVAEIATHLAATQKLAQAAEIITFWRNQQNADRVRDEVLVDLLDQWVAMAQAGSDTLERVRTLSTIMNADPRHAALRNALRDARVDLVERIRDAGKAKDIAALDALAPEVDALPMPLPEFDLWRARVMFAKGEFEKVVELGQTVAASMPETINVWVLMMRAAVKSQNQTLASECAGKVIDLACAKTQKLKAEAEAVLHARAVGA